jgi:hypothetical protein
MYLKEESAPSDLAAAASSYLIFAPLNEKKEKQRG